MYFGGSFFSFFLSWVVNTQLNHWTTVEAGGEHPIKQVGPNKLSWSGTGHTQKKLGKGHFCGKFVCTLANCEWRAAAAGLKPALTARPFTSRPCTLPYYPSFPP